MIYVVSYDEEAVAVHHDLVDVGVVVLIIL